MHYATVSSPDPVALATTLSNDAGGQLLNTIVGVLPVLIPTLLGIWAVVFVYHKFFPKKGLSSLK